MLRRVLLLGWIGAACARAPIAEVTPQAAPVPPSGPRLAAWAGLPAFTFGPGPPSGARLGADGGFGAQPIQGFSGLLANADGGFLAVSDNGYGAPETSADYLLRVYAVQADFEAGRLAAQVLFTLRDPDRLVPWPIVNQLTEERLLTGADLDPESLARAPDGTYWLGDEHGPFLLHADATGRLLDPPIPLMHGGVVVRGPDNPFLRENLLVRSLEALGAHAAARDAGVPFASPDHRWLTSAAQVEQLHRAGFRIVPWTVNDAARIEELVRWGVDGVITDRPDLAGAAFDAGVEVQGHRGARGLAPESTRAAFLAGLDAGVDVLELDVTSTRDGQLIVWHDAVAGPPKCRAPPAVAKTPLPLLDWAALRKARCDGRLPEFPAQRVSADARALLRFDDVLRLGDAKGRAPGLNVETKVHGTGAPGDDAASLTRAVVTRLVTAEDRARVTLQSFDWRALTTAHEEAPWLRTVVLFGDRSARGDDASRAGLPWPVVLDPQVQVKRSGGFENLALSSDGRTLYAVLEKPLGQERECLAFGFDLARKAWTGIAFRVPLHERAVALGDVTMVDAEHGWAIERDDSEGKLDGYKRVVRFKLPQVAGGVISREREIDLLALPRADGGTFAFPFWTIEGIAVLPGGRLAIVNDNNLPFGRARGDAGPDGTELIVVEP